ncbi:serine/threonine protein kinase, partial [Singulisphaera rosea]
LPAGLANHPDYEIRRELGRGGMGVVYLAHNTMMGRDEVLKVMGRQIMERPGVLGRFQREIRAVAKLHHPNIVAAYAAFRIEGGLVFAMEYIEGLDLAKLVRAKGPLSVAHAAYFAHQAALGLQHAHEKGLIHRDIKPHNLMLTPDGKARVVKVLDFGLAKASREENGDGGLTTEGQALGTPDYIAPEQILNAHDVDIRADLYSLGGTLFYLLTGRPPFQCTSLYDVYQAHISRDAEPLNVIRPEVPAELAALVAKMLAKEPRRRFQTPGDVAQALTPFFRSKPLELRPETSQVEIVRTKSFLGNDDTSASTEPGTNDSMPVGRVRSSPEPKIASWNGLIDIREPELISDTPLDVMPSGWIRRFWPAAAGLAALGVLLIVWMVGVFRAKISDGTIVLENLPKDAEVLVDGLKIPLSWPELGSSVRIRAAPGERKIEVEQVGYKTFGDRVTLDAGESEVVNVRLVPLPEKKDVTDEDWPTQVDEHTNRSEIKTSEAAESEDRKQQPDAKEPSTPIALDQLAEGTIWTGSRTYPAEIYRGVTVTYELHIRERDGDKFKGNVFDNGKNRNRAEVEGEVDGEAISWREYLNNGRIVWTIRGTISGGVIQLELVALYERELPNKGKGVLTREGAVGENLGKFEAGKVPDTSLAPNAPRMIKAADRLLPDSVWKGTQTFRSGPYQGKTVHYELHVRERTGRRFQGYNFANGVGRNRAEDEGEVVGASITWQERSPRDDLPYHLMKGRLVGDTIRFQFSDGRGSEGVGELARE